MEALGQVLGRGGSATVFAAERDGRPVAVKVLNEELAASAEDRRRFAHEIDVLSGIEHPAVVRFLGTGTTDDDRPYLVMDRVDGETLAQRLAQGPLPRAEALQRFEALADALVAIHRAGLIHRDVKPSNVMCDGARTVLLDLGIAKSASSTGDTTATGLVRGTPDFMAPERLFGASAGVASDIYELGLLLYCMLAGKPPWDDPTDPSSRHNPAPLDDHVSRAVLRALAVSPAKRPLSVEAFVASVNAAEPPATRVTRVTRTGDGRAEQNEPRTASTPERPRGVRLWHVAALVGCGVLGAWLGGSSEHRPTRSPSVILTPDRSHAVVVSAAVPTPIAVLPIAPSPRALTAPVAAAPVAAAPVAAAPVGAAAPPSTLHDDEAKPTKPSDFKHVKPVDLSNFPDPSVVPHAPVNAPFGPNCSRWLALKCSPEAIARMRSKVPCRSAKESLWSSRAVQTLASEEIVCGNLLR